MSFRPSRSISDPVSRSLALKANNHASEIWESLTIDEPLFVEIQEGKALNLMARGECLERTGDLTKAFEAYENGRSIANDLARKYPMMRRFQLDLASTEMRIGAAFAASQRNDRAIAALNHSLDILAAFPAPSPGELYLKACTWSLVYRVTKHEEDAKESLDALRSALRSGFCDFAMVGNTPALDAIRTRDEYQKLLDDFGFPTLPFVGPKP